MKKTDVFEFLTKLTEKISFIEGRDYLLKKVLINQRIVYVSFIEELMRPELKREDFIEKCKRFDLENNKVIIWGENLDNLANVYREYYIRFPYLETLSMMIMSGVSENSIDKYLEAIIVGEVIKLESEIDTLKFRIAEYQKIIDYIDLTRLGDNCMKSENAKLTEQGVIFEKDEVFKNYQEEEELE